MTGLILKRSPLGPDQNQEDYDVPADGVIVGRDGGVREELAGWSNAAQAILNQPIEPF